MSEPQLGAVLATPMESVAAVAARLAASLLGDGSAVVRRVVSDSRGLQAGDMFVALAGEHFDGHQFLPQAAAAGAVAALVARAEPTLGLAQIVVDDTLAGLQRYASLWRQTLSAPLVAITGSNGKTSTRQLTAAVMAARGPVLATQGNFNNHIGVPLTLCRWRAEHATAVLELGANHAGEIAALAALAQPQVGIVTQAGDAHLEGFGSRDGVAQAKAELFAALPTHGVAIINADDAYAPYWRRVAAHCAQLSFGRNATADVRAEGVEAIDGGSRFVLHTPDASVRVQLRLAGQHNVANALAAAAAGVALGLDAEQIAHGLQSAQAVGGRVQRLLLECGAQLFDDSYNANPSSLRAGLDLLASRSGERWAVLGDMAELGADGVRLHRECGEYARAIGIDRVFAVGALAASYAEGFGPGAKVFPDVSALGDALVAALGPEVSLLVKGSRSARMERVVSRLTGRSAPESH